MNNKKKYDEIIKYIENYFTCKEDLIDFMKSHEEALGIEFPNDGIKFIRISRQENTPSCNVFESNFIGWKDFGSGDSGDIVHLVRLNLELDYLESVDYVYKLLGGENIDLSIDRPKFKPKPKIYAKNINPKFFEFKRIQRKENYDRYMHIMKGFARTLKTDNKIIKIAKFLDIGYDKEYDRVYLPEINEKGEYVGYYAYNREAKPFKEGDKPIKGMIRKNQKPNLTGSHLLKLWNIDLPIILAEGHTDFVNLIGNGYRAITLGAATKTIKPFLNLLKGRTIHIWYDDDLPGIQGTRRIMDEILKFNETVSLKDRILFKPMFWSLEADVKAATPENRGKVFTQNMKNSILKKYQISKDNIFWGKRKVKGYDFTDLLLSMNDMEKNNRDKIKSFLSIYKKEETKQSMF